MSKCHLCQSKIMNGSGIVKLQCKKRGVLYAGKSICAACSDTVYNAVDYSMVAMDIIEKWQSGKYKNEVQRKAALQAGISEALQALGGGFESGVRAMFDTLRLISANHYTQSPEMIQQYQIESDYLDATSISALEIVDEFLYMKWLDVGKAYERGYEKGRNEPRTHATESNLQAACERGS